MRGASTHRPGGNPTGVFYSPRRNDLDSSKSVFVGARDFARLNLLAHIRATTPNTRTPQNTAAPVLVLLLAVTITAAAIL